MLRGIVAVLPVPSFVFPGGELGKGQKRQHVLMCDPQLPLATMATTVAMVPDGDFQKEGRVCCWSMSTPVLTAA
jgi:hypothetical protein